MPKDLEDIFSAVVKYCENLKGNEKCYIRGLNDWTNEDTFLESRIHIGYKNEVIV